MTDLFLLSPTQMRRIERYFPLSHGVARVDDRRIVSAIVFVIRNGLRWRDAPRDFLRNPTGKSRSRMTPSSTNSAIRSKTCSGASRTGGASTLDTTVAPIPTSRQSASPPPSSSGCNQ
jgi:transposase